MTKPYHGTSINFSHHISRGLIACYPLNEGTGDKVYDLSGNNNIGTVQDPATTWVSGRDGWAVDFDDSVDDYVWIDNSSVYNNLTRMSIHAIFRLRTLPSVLAHHEYIIRKNHTVSPFNAWGIYCHLGNDKIYGFIRNDSSTYKEVATNNSISINNTYNIVFIYDGSNINMYVNGLLDTSPVAQTGEVFTSDFRVHLGAATGTSNRLDGQIELVNIWNRVLTQAEITALAVDPYVIFRKRSKILSYS